MPRHPSITTERLLNLCEERERTCSNPGVCVACGEDQEGCESDASGILCESCGEKKVSSPEILLGIY